MSPTHTLIGPLELELQLFVANAGKEALCRRAGVPNLRHARLDAVPAHEARDAVLAHPMTSPAQHLMHPRASVGPTALHVCHADPLDQRLVLALTLATLARAPGIEARSRYSIDPAHQRDVVLIPVYF